MNGDRVYSALLALYPRAFRRRYREEMTEAFRDLGRDRRQSTVTFWTLIVSDLVCSSFRERVEGCRTGTKRFVFVWMAFCVLGIIVTGVLSSALTWTVGYLYHPYLDGFPWPPWAYGAVLGLALGTLQAAALRRYLHVSVEWIRFLLAGAVAVALGLLSLGISIDQTSGGLNPLANDGLFPTYGEAINVLWGGLYGRTSWNELAAAGVAMAVSGIVVGVLTAWPVRSLAAPERKSC